MLAYLLVEAVLFALLTAWVFKPEWGNWLGGVGAIVLTLFAALRFETGYDWLAYETYYETVVDLRDLCGTWGSGVSLLVEPLFNVLSVGVKSAGGDVQSLFFIIAIFNMAMIYAVTRKISNAQPLMWIVYLGFAYLIAQFAVLRQAVASGFVLVALYYAASDRRICTWSALVLSLGFHVSAAVFAPILLLHKWLPSWKLVVPFLAFGATLALLSIDLVRPAIGLVLDYLPSWFALKLAFYEHVDLAPVSVAALGLVGLHLTVLAAFYLCTTKDEKRDPFIIIAVWLTILLLTSHLYLAGFPSFWNRFMMVSLPWQISALFRIRRLVELTIIPRAGIALALTIFSIGALSYTLAKPSSLPFIPYDSVIHQALGYDANGRERLRAAILLFDEYQSDLKTVDTSTVAAGLLDGIVKGLCGAQTDR
jgi:hypothetical protein